MDSNDYTTPLPGEDKTQDERLKEAYEDVKTAAKELGGDQDFRIAVTNAAIVVAGSYLVYRLVKRSQNKREAAKLAKNFFDLRVTKEQVALLQSADLNVLYDTPFGQLLLAAVPPLEG